MKSKYKLIFVIIITTALVFSLSLNIYALEKTNYVNNGSESSETIENIDQIVINFGYEEKMIRNMNEQEKLNLATAILNDPLNVKQTQIVNSIDEISTIEMIVNSTDEVLLNYGMSQDDLNQARRNIEYLTNLTDEELTSNFQRSSEQVKLLRMALMKNDAYTTKDIQGTCVSSSGNISQTQLEFTLSSYDNRSLTKKAVSYRAIVYFDWNQQPWFHFNDQVAVCWGGNLNSMSLSRYLYTENNLADHYATGTNSGYVCSRVVSTVDQSPNTGILYKFEMAPVDNPGSMTVWTTHGYFYQTIYQNQKQNYDTKILARYGHRIPSIGFSSMSFTSTPTISLGWGMDYSYQPEVTITY